MKPIGMSILVLAFFLPMRVLINADDSYAGLNEDLQDAILKGDTTTTKALIDKGADVNAKSKYGVPLLTLAAAKGDIEIIKLFIDKGADVNAKNAEGITTLMRAAEKGHIEIIRLLIDKGADVNVKEDSSFGFTALIDAANHGHIEIVKLLIDKGADVPSVPSGAAALISSGGWAYVDVEEIDGHATLAGMARKKQGAKLTPDEVRALAIPILVLPPGVHKLKLSYNGGSRGVGKPISLDIHAESGGIYYINYEIETKKWRAWIERYK